eukprot:6569013-Prymnesium_polylepis.1
MVTSSGKLRNMSSRSITSLVSSGVQSTSAARRLSWTLTSAASAAMASRRSPTPDMAGSSEPSRSSTTSVATRYVGCPGAERLSADCSTSHLARSCTTSLLYVASTSFAKSVEVLEAVRAASQSLDVRSIARHVSDTSCCSPSYELASAVRAMFCSLPASDACRSSQ